MMIYPVATVLIWTSRTVLKFLKSNRFIFPARQFLVKLATVFETIFYISNASLLHSILLICLVLFQDLTY